MILELLQRLLPLLEILLLLGVQMRDLYRVARTLHFV